MKIRSILVFFIFLGLTTSGLFTTQAYLHAADDNALQVGYAEVNITPELGHTMPGYFSERRATGVLDPLLSRALVLTQGETTLAIVALDLIGVKRPVVLDIKSKVHESTDIPTDHIFVHATHTHTGVTVSEIADALPGQVAESVVEAMKNQEVEQKVTLGKSKERSIAFIRRYLMKDGSIRTNPGRGNPNIVHPIGDIDPNVHVMTFNSVKSMIVSYGLHLDCIGGTQFSADYPYHMTEAIKEELGKEWDVVFLNACSGNVNHIDVNNPDQRSGYKESRRIGHQLAKAALKAHHSSKEVNIDQLAGTCKTVQSPIRSVPKELYQWAKMQMENNPDEASKRRFNEPTPYRIIDLAEKQEKSRPADITVFRLGPVGLVGLPGEVFVENAMDIKAHSLLDPTLVIGITGGYMGYIPHPRGYDEGGYEATYGSARYSPETPILWNDTASQLILTLKNQ